MASWSCQRSGECCTRDVIMTREEQHVVEDAATKLTTGIGLVWRVESDPRFVRLVGGPCPLLRWEGVRAACAIWTVRPYNCRRFACFRDDVEAEPLMPDGTRFGFANLTRRIMLNRDIRRQYARLQRKAQAWARAHGWIDMKTRTLA